MGETIIFDPAEVAEQRAELNPHTGPYKVKTEGIDWGDAVIAAYMVEGVRGSLPVDYRLPNREVKMPMMVQAIAGEHEAGLTNLVTNPSFEVGTTGWLTTDALFLAGGATLSRVTSQQYVGAASAQVGTTGVSQGIANALSGTFDSGVTYRADVYVKGNAGGEALAVFFGSATASDWAYTNIAVTSGWARYSVVWTPSAARSDVVLTVRQNGSGFRTYFVDAVQVIQGSAALDYFDGDSYDADWTGTPHASTSITVSSFDKGRADLQSKLGLWQRKGGWVSREFSNGTKLYLRVVNATLKMGGDTPQAIDEFDQNIDITLETVPEWFGDRVALPEVEEETAGLLTMTVWDVEGDHPGILEVEVEERGGQQQLGCVFGLRDLDPSEVDLTTNDMDYEAESLTPLDAATAGAFTGASGGSLVSHTNLSSAWTPVLSTDLAGVGPLTHKGTYQVLARLYSASGPLVQARLIYDTGDLAAPEENDPWTFPSASNFHWANLGQVQLDPAPIGDHHWTGHIQARGSVGGETFRVDKIVLVPLDETAGTLRAPRTSPNFTNYLARDGFNQSAGLLSGKPMAAASSISTKYPGTAASDSSYGTAVWGAAPYGANPPSKIGATDSDPTIATDSGAGYATSQYLKATNFGFALPVGATVDGIGVAIRRCNSSGDYQRDYTTDSRVRIVKGGAVQSTDKADTATKWPQAPSYGWKFYGSATDKWGSTWLYSDINASNFGVVLSAYMRDAAAMVDALHITVYYTDAAGQSWSVAGDTDSFSVEAVSHTAQRTIATADADINTGAFGIAGTTLYTDVLAGVDIKRSVLTAGAAARQGAVARYVDPNNWLYAGLDFRSTDTYANRIVVLKRVAGTVTELRAVTTQNFSITESYVSIWLDVDSFGRFAVYAFLQNATVELVAAGYDADLATGAVLDDGKVGFYDSKLGATAATRYFDNFFIAIPTRDAVLFPIQTLQLRSDGCYRADSPGGSYGLVPLLEGDLPRIPPSGLEDRAVQLLVMLSRGDMDVMPDPAFDPFTVRGYYRPCWLFVTGEAQPES